MNDSRFDELLNNIELNGWQSLKDVNFLGNIKSPNYIQLVEKIVHALPLMDVTKYTFISFPSGFSQQIFVMSAINMANDFIRTLPQWEDDSRVCGTLVCCLITV